MSCPQFLTSSITSISLLRAAMLYFTGKSQEEHLLHLTSLQAVHDAPQPHLLARQVYDYAHVIIFRRQFLGLGNLVCWIRF